MLVLAGGWFGLHRLACRLPCPVHASASQTDDDVQRGDRQREKKIRSGEPERCYTSNVTWPTSPRRQPHRGADRSSACSGKVAQCVCQFHSQPSSQTESAAQVSDIWQSADSRPTRNGPLEAEPSPSQPAQAVDGVPAAASNGNSQKPGDRPESMK